MRTHIRLPFVALVVVVLLATVMPAAVAGEAGPSAQGNAIFLTEAGDKITNAYNVRMFPDGSVRGQFETHRAGFYRLHAELDCLRIVGNAAFMSGVITHTDVPDEPHRQVGDPVMLWVEDNGEGATADPDRVSFLMLGDWGGCEEDPFIMIVRPVVAGNVQVKG